jgi:hypothetical protein
MYSLEDSVEKQLNSRSLHYASLRFHGRPGQAG